MLKDILNAAGVKNRQGRYMPPIPTESYAVYFDDVERDGADPVTPGSSTGLPGIYHHTGRIELYEPRPDDKTEAAIEAEFDARGLPWSKEDRYWLQDVQRYQVLYEIDYTSKN